jgi:hypothetical protein
VSGAVAHDLAGNVSDDEGAERHRDRTQRAHRLADHPSPAALLDGQSRQEPEATDLLACDCV